MKSFYITLMIVCTLGLTEIVAKDDVSDEVKEEREKEVKTQSEILADLCAVIRNIAFPKTPYSINEPVQNRMIFMSPGKVLDYDDYYPGDEYTDNLKAKNMSAPYALVPPSVMEKWFELANVVVGGAPTAGDTEKSMSEIYERIVSQITIRDFTSLSEQAEARYEEAKKYLTEKIQNPVNLTEEITRMRLYSVYQDKYNLHRLNMENKINDARLSMSSLDYQLWFQRNYKLLNAKVENAYSEWLVFGQKVPTEFYKSYMDVATADTGLEEARVALRASGVTSLDRTRTIYPVSFEPGNWYEYLLVKRAPPSRDTLIAQRSMLQTEIETEKKILKSLSHPDTKGKADELASSLEENVNEATNKRSNASKAAIDARIDCISNQLTENRMDEDPCKKLRKKVDSAVDAAFKHARASSDYFRKTFHLNTDQKYERYLRSKIAALERHIADINDQLDNLDGDQVYLGEIADSPEFSILHKKDEQDLDAQWMRFDFNSEDVQRSVDAFSVDVDRSIGVSGAVKNVSFGGSFEMGVGVQQVNDALNKASVRTTGELLRVFIKRPWFKPSLFNNPLLNFVQRDSETGKTAYVSPPPANDRKLAEIVDGFSDNIYLMPEYVTSFLLARNVRLEFSGMDSKTASTAIQVSAGLRANAGIQGYGMFGGVNSHLSANYGRRWANTRSRTDGMVIEIPGAQIIAYYTNVMPQFPKQQNN